ncbi:FkbM family methyltransferase [Horticoccus sp. 23ND18S-11]|uniref:FkbM family methyltransferase n=1 Tax=Horticoccus sp. 23ND18S-11 TaxID=3391832 RepID=UPI0039C8F072
MSLISALRSVLRHFPRVHLFAARLKHAANATVIRMFGLGYVQRRITGGPLAGHWFVASKRVYYSPWFWNGSYEEETCRFLQAVVPAEAVCYDIGANLGYHTLIMAGSAKRGQVLAFEPLPQVCEVLGRNLAINGVRNVTVVRKVAARQSGVVTLAKSVEIDQATMKYAADAGSSRSLELIACDAVTLDEFVAQGGVPPTFLKIDVEGAEVDVLAGATEVLRRYRPTVLCETHGAAAAQGVYQLLHALGYTLYRVTSQLEPIASAAMVPTNMNEGHLFARHE